MRVFITIFIVLIIPNISFTQEYNEILSNVNTITINTSEMQSDLHFNWGKYLVQNGFEIANNDKDYFTIKTYPKDFSAKNCDCEFYIFSSILENGNIKSKIKLRFKSSGIDLIAGGREYPFYDWEYQSKKKNPGFTLYQKVAPLFNGFGDYEITYSIQ